MSLRDSLSRAFQKKVAPTQTRGVGGSAIYGGYIATRETSPKLVGAQRWTTYQEILANTSIVASGIRLFLNLCAKPKWSVKPADLGPNGEGAAEEAAQFVETAMHGMATPWHRIVRRQAMYRFHGFAVQEWTAKREKDGRFIYADIEPRPPFTCERWEVDDTGSVEGVWQRSPQTGESIPLPRWKLLYSVDDTLLDSPEGMGLLRHIAEPAARLKEYLALEQIGFQTDLRGIPVGRAPYAELQEKVDGGLMDAATRDRILEPLRGFIDNHMRARDTAALLDSETFRDKEGNPSSVSMYALELMKGDGSGQQEVAAAIQRLNEEIARILGVEHLLLGTGSSGSRALGDTKVEQFSLMVDSAIRDLAETMRADFIGPLWWLNGLDEEAMPSFEVESVQVRALGDLVDMATGLAQAGVPLMPWDDAVEEIFSIAGLSNPDRDGSEPAIGHLSEHLEGDAEGRLAGEG